MNLKEYKEEYIRLSNELDLKYKKYMNSKFSVDVSDEVMKGLALEKANVNKKVSILLKNKNAYTKAKDNYDSFAKEYANALFIYYKNKNPKLKNINNKEVRRFNEIFPEFNDSIVEEIILIKFKKSIYKIKRLF